MAPSPPIDHRLKGIALRLGAASCFGVMGAATKYSAIHGVSTYELMFYRNLFAFPVILSWLAFGPGFRSVRTARGRAHGIRSLIGLTAMALTFQAIAMLPLAEATAINFTAPLFATLLSALFLHERVGLQRMAAVAAGMIGVVIVMQPGSGTIAVTGMLVGLAGAFVTAGAHLTIRQIGATEPATTTVFWFNVVTVVVLAPGMIHAGVAHPLAAWPALVVMGLAGGFAQIMLTASLRAAPVSVLAPFDYVQIIWAVLFGWLLLSDRPTVAMLAGAGLITMSGIYTAWRERRLMRRLNRDL